MSEGCIQKIKWGLPRKFFKTGFPNHLWDHYIELQALIISRTDHSNYELDSKVLATRMTGQTADISNICEYSWYERIIFRYQHITYPY